MQYLNSFDIKANQLVLTTSSLLKGIMLNIIRYIRDQMTEYVIIGDFIEKICK